jgi:cytochrome P450
MLNHEVPVPPHAVAAVTHPDPYPYYAQLRQRPMQFDAGLNAWVVSSAALIAAALAHPALRVRPPHEPVPHALAGTPAGAVFAQLVRMNDGAFHAAHKPAVRASATRWSPDEIGDVAAGVTRRLASGGDANALLTGVPVQSVARLLGVPEPECAATSQWVHAFTQGIAPGASTDAVNLANEAAAALMAQGAREGMDAVRAANRIALMQQSLDATAGLIGNTACLALRQPEWQAALRHSMDQARAMVAEIVRWDAPVQNTRRFVAEDCVLAGQALRTGDTLLLVLGSGNRDAALNARPDAFEPDRTDRRNLTFGAGVHQCPGELLATEVAAVCLHGLALAGPLSAFFGAPSGFRPLANARIPTFG